MKIFLDTSALAKRYIQEPGSEELEDLFCTVVTDIFVATLALPEFAAAVGRKIRDQEIAIEAAADAMKEFEQDWYNLFTKISLTDTIASSASSLALKYPIKGADAVHIATAVSVKTSLFVVSDQQIVKVSGKIGLKAYDPSTGPFQCPK